MGGMADASLNQKVINRLAAGENPDEITWDLCNQANLSWPEAEALVQKIRVENENVIARKQSPLTILLAVMIFTGGLAVIAGGLYIILTAFALYTASREPANAIGFVAYAIHYWPAASMLILSRFGAVMGSMIGMKKVWDVLLDRFFDRLGL